MCEHSPLSAEDCKPNKALRLTVKAFLKSEEKKRDKGRAGGNAVSSAPSAPQAPAESSVAVSTEQTVVAEDSSAQDAEVNVGAPAASSQEQAKHGNLVAAADPVKGVNQAIEVRVGLLHQVSAV